MFAVPAPEILNGHQIRYLEHTTLRQIGIQVQRQTTGGVIWNVEAHAANDIWRGAGSKHGIEAGLIKGQKVDFDPWIEFLKFADVGREYLTGIAHDRQDGLPTRRSGGIAGF